MSVDNYYTALQANCFTTYLFHLRFGVKKAAKAVVKKIIHYNKYKTYSLSKLRNNKNVVCNAYQSQYAKNFLQQKKLQNILSLSDYINEDYKYNSSVTQNKKNIILYNPKKGWNFTKKLISKAPELDWIPIQNMTRDQVKDIMLKSKLYIDFGNFPGKDRMSREAAMCGCCILTGKLGASAFYEDVMIDENYKFNQSRKNIPVIVNKIRTVLNNYENEINNFSNYRDFIQKEKELFEKDSLKLFSIIGEDGIKTDNK